MNGLVVRRLGHDDLEILWAAMTAMVEDLHGPQEALTEEQWERARELWRRLDAEMNSRLEEKES